MSTLEIAVAIIEAFLVGRYWDYLLNFIKQITK